MLAIGADAASDAARNGAAIVVARDAGTVLDRSVFEETIAGGRAVAWKDKKTLGGIVGREEVAVIAVTNESVAEEIAHVRRIAESVVMGGEQTRGEACRSREVR